VRLKKLSLAGFKSFASKITLHFDLPIIGIVGPNGCGKSNVVDAFRWVMGEQSARSLRGERMEDLLFAGSTSLNASNIAEVSVTLSDIDGELPIDYEEVVITRRCYREGESDYLINNNPVRLKDIQNLLLGSGLGKNAFSIFEQGKLDAVISLPPSERRVILDEAAGTSRFLMKKKESLKKLEQVEINLNRVKDIHEEVKGQTRLLAKQAAIATSYKENQERLILCQKTLLIRRQKSICSKKEELQIALALIKNDESELTLTLNFFEKQLKEVSKQLLSFEELREERRSKISFLESRFQILASEKRHKESTQLQNAQKNIELSKKLEELSFSFKADEKEATSLEEAIDGALKRKNEEKTRLLLLENALEGLEVKLTEARERNKRQSRGYLEALNEEKLLFLSLQENHRQKEISLEKEKSLQEATRESSLAREELSALIPRKQEGVELLLEEIAKLKSGAAAQQESLKDLSKAESAHNQKTINLQRRIAENRARQQTLQRLKEEMEGFSDGAKKLLKAAKNPKSPLFGKIKEFASLLSFKEHDKAFESALRTYAATLVVDLAADRQMIFDYAKEHQLSDFSLLCLEHLKADFTGHFSEKWDLVENLPLKPGKRPLLNYQGAFFDISGVYFSEKSAEPIFRRQKEMITLANEIELEERELNALEMEKKTLLEQSSKVQSSLSHLLETMRTREMTLVQENFVLQRSKADQERLQGQFEEIQKNLSKIQNTILLLEKSQLEKGEEHQAASEKTQLAEVKIKEYELEEKSLHDELKKARQNREEQSRTYGNAANLLQKQEHAKQLLNQKVHQRGEERTRCTLEIQASLAAIVKGKELIASLEKELLDNQKILADLSVKKHQEDESFKKCKHEEKELRGSIEAKKELLKTEEKKSNQLEIEIAKVSQELEEIEKALNDRYANKIETDSLDISESAIEEEIGRLRYAIEKAGAVNMTSIEEYQEVEKRYSFLQNQLQDLEKTREDLEKIITSLDSECRKIFRKTFNEIRKNFQKNFQILFGGGEADLKFTDSADILVAGIEIIAKPPGKQMRAISLLSGGEKCLTALSLLFAIFEVRPAPFCILDEVDAPLDESNIDRFTSLLKQFIKKTQFIIVTHNKKTMTICDRLFGVSMQQRGVSTLISLSFEKNREGQISALSHASISNTESI